MTVPGPCSMRCGREYILRGCTQSKEVMIGSWSSTASCPCSVLQSRTFNRQQGLRRGREGQEFTKIGSNKHSVVHKVYSNNFQVFAKSVATTFGSHAQHSLGAHYQKPQQQYLYLQKWTGTQSTELQCHGARGKVCICKNLQQPGKSSQKRSLEDSQESRSCSQVTKQSIT